MRIIGDVLTLFGMVRVPLISPVVVFSTISDSVKSESVLSCADNPEKTKHSEIIKAIIFVFIELIFSWKQLIFKYTTFIARLAAK
jgi:hypothetical protein